MPQFRPAPRPDPAGLRARPSAVAAAAAGQRHVASLTGALAVLTALSVLIL